MLCTQQLCCSLGHQMSPPKKTIEKQWLTRSVLEKFGNENVDTQRCRKHCGSREGGREIAPTRKSHEWRSEMRNIRPSPRPKESPGVEVWGAPFPVVSRVSQLLAAQREVPVLRKLARLGNPGKPRAVKYACVYRREPAMLGRPGLLWPFVRDARDPRVFAVGSITPTFGLDPNTLL